MRIGVQKLGPENVTEQVRIGKSKWKKTSRGEKKMLSPEFFAWGAIFSYEECYNVTTLFRNGIK